MDRSTQQRRMQEAETEMLRLEENISFQQQMVAKLDQHGHDVRAARLFLKRLKGQHAKLIVERDQLFRELAGRV